MNKICGYSCEHNKGGICQITTCDKHIYLNTSTTTKPEIFTRWQDPVIENQNEKIKELTNLLKEYKNANNYLQKIVHELETIKTPNEYHRENVKLRTVNDRQKDKIEGLYKEILILYNVIDDIENLLCNNDIPKKVQEKFENILESNLKCRISGNIPKKGDKDEQ